ncbi:hypothetical protein CKY51_22025 [Xanthomonas maliensis]|nr:hypothetical protein CKY51_22025 [Xanthomonas maliensis]
MSLTCFFGHLLFDSPQFFIATLFSVECRLNILQSIISFRQDNTSFDNPTFYESRLVTESALFFTAIPIMI